MSEVQVETVIDLVHQPLAVLDRELRVRHANPAFRELFGVKDAKGVPLSEIVKLDLQELGSVLETGKILRHFELAARGKTLIMDARASAEANTILVAFEDVTERREVERALRHHQFLFAANTDMIMALDNHWRVLSWNPAAERLLGYTAAEAIGRRSEEIIHVDPTAVDRAGARAKLAAGETLTSEARLRHKNGEWIETRTSTVPVRDDDGTPTGYLCIVHDIRETKALERQLRDHARTVEEANRELDSFTYSVSHDLRAPLRAIDGFSRILVEDYGERMTKEEMRLLHVIRKNTQQMGQLIDDLLAFARLGRKELVVSPVDMKALCIELVPEVLAGTEDREIDLRAGFVPSAYGDRALLKQVWLNLMSNAIKYTRKRKHASIQISGEATETECIYKIQDNGAGFDMAYRDKLFGVFQRLHRNTEFEGTGVGLALVARIVRRHGGRVWAEGKEDEGATFYFALPRHGDEDG